MSKEAFEEWAASRGYGLEVDDGNYVDAKTEAASAGYEARQPEIDNLLARVGSLVASNTEWKELYTDLTKAFLEAQQEIGRLKTALKGKP